MNAFIAVLLVQDGLTTGAIYALIAIALVMLFSVTRVVFVPQGEIVSFAALTLASLQAGTVPGSAWLLVAGGLAVALVDGVAATRREDRRVRVTSAALYGLGPLLAVGAAQLVLGADAPLAAQVAVTIALVAPLGPIVYRLAFAPLADASVLVLLMTAVAVHFALVGLGLMIFGAEGARTTPLLADSLPVAGAVVSEQALLTIGVSATLMAAMAAFFRRTLRGKALRATAMNRVGARIVGIPTASAGVLAFGLAGSIGAVSGVLISSLTTIYYDTGFLIGLKGFIAAIVGAMSSYALAVFGALAIGGLETASSFYASAYKEAIVFALIVPILVWRSLASRQVEEHEE